MNDSLPNRDEILEVLQSHAPRAMHVGELFLLTFLSRTIFLFT